MGATNHAVAYEFCCKFQVRKQTKPQKAKNLRNKTWNKRALKLDIVVRNIFGVVVLQRIKSEESRWQLPFYSLKIIASIDGIDISTISEPPARLHNKIATITALH